MPYPAAGCGAAGVRLVPARQLAVPAGRRSAPPATAAPIAAAPARRRSPRSRISTAMHAAAAGRDDADRAAVRHASAADRRYRPWGGRGNAAGGRAATNSPGSGRPKQYYDRLAGGAEVARLRSAEPQRPGRLPVHHAARRERYLARADETLDPNPPRKADSTGITGRRPRPRRADPGPRATR